MSNNNLEPGWWEHAARLCHGFLDRQKTREMFRGATHIPTPHFLAPHHGKFSRNESAFEKRRMLSQLYQAPDGDHINPDTQRSHLTRKVLVHCLVTRVH